MKAENIVYLKPILKDDVMSFAMLLALSREMEGNLKGSFLEADTWKQLITMRSY